VNSALINRSPIEGEMEEDAKNLGLKRSYSYKEKGKLKTNIIVRVPIRHEANIKKARSAE
jgi:hypothetical protein